VVEFGAALHVLGDPGHHRSTAWAALIRASMSPRLAAWTGSWSWTAEAIRAAPLVTASPPTEDFLARVQALRLMPSRTVADQILRPISRPDDQSLALRWGRSRGPRLATVVETLVQRPDEAVADFLGFLEFSWHEWFAADWARIRPLLAARAREFADATAKQDAVAALTSIDPAVSAAPGGVVLAKIQNRRHDVARRGLLVVPSVFTSPHLYVADVPGQPLLLIHPAERGDPVPSVAELLRRLNVVAHPGRLDVARAIATEPRTAGEIAALWGMDATLVNRHLRALAAAGLAGTQRRGRFVQYRLNAAAVQALGTDLLSTLLR
jgi:DNA-binding transcriptional ArsR family regulator